MFRVPWCSGAENVIPMRKVDLNSGHPLSCCSIHLIRRFGRQKLGHSWTPTSVLYRNATVAGVDLLVVTGN
jgi:hypothetical protein